MIPKESFCAWAVREVSLASGVIILSLYFSRAQLLPLALFLECLGENKAAISHCLTNTSCPVQRPICLLPHAYMCRPCPQTPCKQLWLPFEGQNARTQGYSSIRMAWPGKSPPFLSCGPLFHLQSAFLQFLRPSSHHPLLFDHSASLCFSLLRTIVTASLAHLDNPGYCLHLKIFNLLASAKLVST